VIQDGGAMILVENSVRHGMISKPAIEWACAYRFLFLLKAIAGSKRHNSGESHEYATSFAVHDFHWRELKDREGCDKENGPGTGYASS
jgi:hypothetical protein